MNNILQGLKYSYRVVTKDNGPSGKPLPHMTQYYLQDENGKQISFWNNVPIALQGDIVNTCIEIPKEIHSKIECTKQLPFHPFMQDTRKNFYTQDLQLRFYAQFPMFNYGYIPQTWEQNVVRDKYGYFGDNDPIDILDLSTKKMNIGDIIRSKILGGFCLIDQGEIDWKLFTIDSQQSEQKQIRSINDIDPRLIQSIIRWFKITKVYDGKKQNQVAFNDKIFSKQQTIQIIQEVHQYWHTLMTSDDPIYIQKRKEFHIQ